jgi:hypothetical protein
MANLEDRIKSQLERGKISLAKDSIKEKLLAEDKAKFDKAMQEEYNLLFPVTREATDAEYEANFTEQVGLDEIPTYPYFEDGSRMFTFYNIEIDYSEDEAYITLEEYKNEVRVIQEATEDVTDPDTGITISGLPEITEKVRPYTPMSADELNVAVEATDEIKAYKAKLAVETKKDTLDTLVITANTVAYDANGKAIGNMSAVVGLANFKFNQALAQGVAPVDAYQAVYKDTIIGWKGADNLPHEVQVESICEALEAGMIEVAKVVL